ncbi:MAG: ABC transporter ATP-binding protein [Frankiaceae bacterium]
MREQGSTGSAGSSEGSGSTGAAGEAIAPRTAGGAAFDIDRSQPTVIVDDLHVDYRVVLAADSDRRVRYGQQHRRLKRLLARRRVQIIHAVRGVSFTTYRGEAIGVIGRNGSGKSTLLRAIAGLMPIARGAVYAKGQPSLLGVNAALVPALSGAHNVELGCLALGMSPEEMRRRYDTVVKFSGIRPDRINLPMKAYSSGMSARLRFAIAQSAVPDVLLIDEALATGDRQFKRRSELRIEQLRKEAGTVFIVSHSNADILKMCNRALWLEDGELVMDGPVDEVVGAYEEATDD